MTFGRGISNFYFDEPAAVAQAIGTRLNLWTGDWWLDLTQGTPWLQQILGKPRAPGSSPDAALRTRILGTPYVTRLSNYSSVWNSTTRAWVVSGVVDTAFGQTAFVTAVPLPAVAATQARLPAPQRQLTYRR
jgi:hypothetical protein